MNEKAGRQTSPAAGLRSVLLALLWPAASMVMSAALAQATAVERPEAAKLQHGDLIWPKNPKSIVPYDTAAEATREEQQRQWESERNAFVARVREPARNSSPQLLQTATNLEALSYSEFTLLYLSGLQKSDIARFGGADDLFSVGHVGIVEVAPDGRRYVIEAVWGKVKAVQRVLYDDWLKGRAESWVWVGRIRDLGAADRAKFVEQAKAYLGKPYDFWNFDLADESGFYCSKLVWLSLARSANLYVDGDPSSQRSFWFSPKQLWNTGQIVRVNVPRNYTY